MNNSTNLPHLVFHQANPPWSTLFKWGGGFHNKNFCCSRLKLFGVLNSEGNILIRTGILLSVWCQLRNTTNILREEFKMNSNLSMICVQIAGEIHSNTILLHSNKNFSFSWSSTGSFISIWEHGVVLYGSYTTEHSFSLRCIYTSIITPSIPTGRFPIPFQNKIIIIKKLSKQKRLSWKLE